MTELQTEHNLAQVVQQLREARGWSRKELAERAALHPSHIGLIERSGRVGVRPETLEKIAGAFGIPVARLLGESPAATESPSDLEPFRGAIEAARQHGLTPEQLLGLINTTAGLFKK